jgi:Raf kinase inhibitor-like YbhB/YbcL family protein
MAFRLASSAFAAGDVIPQRHTADGADLSPSLSWSDPPAGAQEFALIVDDPDAPSPHPWVHWVLYKIPVGATELPEGLSKTSAPAGLTGLVQGRNSWGTFGYRGPSPPRGAGQHHYHFRLYALNAPLEAPPGVDKDELLSRMKDKILATALLSVLISGRVRDARKRHRSRCGRCRFTHSRNS